MSLRLLTPADETVAAALLGRAGLTSGVQNVGRYLRWQPDGVWGAFDVDGALVGTVSLLRQGPDVGFVGCMAVEPLLQGSGVGRALLVHAHQAGRRAGIRTFLLEATPAGAHLYRRFGYEAEHETLIMVRRSEADGGPAGERISTRDHRAIQVLDADATGVDRAVKDDGADGN